VFLTVNAIETGQAAWYDRIFLALNVMQRRELEIELDRVRYFTLSSPQQRLGVAIEIITCLRKLPNWRRKECCTALETLVELPQAKLASCMMNWQEAQTMRKAGIAFGSHTLSHPVVSQLTPEELETELAESKQILEEKLDAPILDFAFPFGHLADCGMERTLPVVARCGYRSASTAYPGVNTADINPLSLLRVQIGIEHDLAMFALRLNQLFLFADHSRPEILSRQGFLSLRSADSDRPHMVPGTRHA
jgi:hypothetical protein